MSEAKNNYNMWRPGARTLGAIDFPCNHTSIHLAFDIIANEVEVEMASNLWAMCI